MKKLVINADDFGIDITVNKAVESAFKNGVLTSATIIPCGKSYENAIDIAERNPQLGVGIHLTLVAERPVSSCWKIPSLIGSEGRFYKSYVDFLKGFIVGKIAIKDIETEARAQIEKVLDSNLTPTHLDSHQHLHVFPKIAGLVCRLAKDYNIDAVRLPRESMRFVDSEITWARHIARNGLTAITKMSAPTYSGKDLRCTDNFFGMLYGGALSSQRLKRIIDRLPEGTSEIMIHPAIENEAMQRVYQWNYDWQQEYYALCDPTVKSLIEEKNVRLVNYRTM